MVLVQNGRSICGYLPDGVQDNSCCSLHISRPKFSKFSRKILGRFQVLGKCEERRNLRKIFTNLHFGNKIMK